MELQHACHLPNFPHKSSHNNIVTNLETREVGLLAIFIFTSSMADLERS
jgi:hypothetical protein